MGRKSIRGARVRLCLLGLLGALAVSGVAAWAASSGASAGGGPVEFASAFHSSEVYVANADGRAARRLTNDVLGSRWPTLSPDGSQVAFARKSGGSWGVYVMNLDGTGLK